MIRRPPRSTLSSSSAASDVYKRQVVEFTDALQGGLEFLVIAQPLLDEGFLFFGEADLLVAAAGIADGQHPDEMALTASTDGAAGAMADAAAEQGATQDLGSGGEGGSEPGAGADDCLVLHL